ncbi:response regulator transcription factor [Acidaminobacter sp.]|uniref:response regulator transcription factor n=1 Tax=Acidaminobacter sp. TaxID=1872102 RepID=UPI001382E0DC|nr:response regulator transcription factor [Acidaminobacter sp.]MDK9710197.1 response regulator transcription factor [Acidaminobacter sp.]MZQ98717.1 response regulator [Acidaminobacter sp.]
MAVKVLIADDEKQLADSLSYAFRREGYLVLTAYEGKAALEIIMEKKPDLVILDISMPRMTGYEILKEIQGVYDLGVMLLTARNDIVDKVIGLELGADDYITKPFDMREVLARAAALVRRLNKGQQETLLSWGVEINERNRTTILKGEVLELTPKEFELLFLLMRHENQVFSREALLDQIWGMDYEGGERTVDLHVQRLRKKLGQIGEAALQTVYRVGYKWAGERREKL